MNEETPMAATQGELRVVVGVDGSDRAKRALCHAAHDAARTGAILQVVSVYNVPTEGSWVRTGLFHEEATAIVKESLEQVRRIEPDVVSKGAVTLGLPGQVLTDMAEGASSLVVGSRGHGHLSSLILGSVSEYVLHHATCTTTIVR